jgi:hypothetical protein
VADHQKDFSSVYKPFWFNFINSEGIAFPFYCIYLHILYYKACKWLKYNGFGLQSLNSELLPKFRSNQSSVCYSILGHSSLILLFHCTNGADQTGPINTREPLEGHAHLSYVREVQPSTYARCGMRTTIDTPTSLHLAYVREVRMPLQSGPTVSL